MSGKSTYRRLRPLVTFSREHVHLSSEAPVYVRWERYPGTEEHPMERYGTAPPPFAPMAGLEMTRTYVDPHGHDFYEIVFVCKGEGRHVTNAGYQDLIPGTVLVVPRAEVHGYESLHGFECVNLFYVAEWLAGDVSDLWRQPGIIHLFLEKAILNKRREDFIHTLSLSEHAFEACKYELVDIANLLARPTVNLLYLKGCLNKLFVILAENYVEQIDNAPTEHFREEIWFVLDQVENAIGSGEPLNVGELAEGCVVTPEHLTRLFKKAVGMSIMQYFQRRRVQCAARALLTREIGISEIGHELGYTDYAHFRRVFIRFYGIAPGDYRRQFS